TRHPCFSRLVSGTYPDQVLNEERLRIATSPIRNAVRGRQRERERAEVLPVRQPVPARLQVCRYIPVPIGGAFIRGSSKCNTRIWWRRIGFRNDSAAHGNRHRRVVPTSHGERPALQETMRFPHAVPNGDRSIRACEDK